MHAEVAITFHPLCGHRLAEQAQEDEEEEEEEEAKPGRTPWFFGAPSSSSGWKRRSDREGRRGGPEGKTTYRTTTFLEA